MQSIYALLQSNSDDLVKEEKYLKFSITSVYHLYVLMLGLLSKVRDLAENHQEIAKKKYLATSEDINPSRNFIDNEFLLALKNNKSLHEYLQTQKLNQWNSDNEYVRLIWDAIFESDIYKSYIQIKDTSSSKDFEFIVEIYKHVIAPNEKLFDYFESQKLSWVDDIPFVNTWILKNIKRIKPTTVFDTKNLYKDIDDEHFVKELFEKVTLHHTEFTQDIDQKTPNWDTDRIAEIDLILIKMALVEFIYFPSIPTRVTINEYIEIAKDYSTNKSGFFINGVLDKMLKEFNAAKRIEKIGRGLL